MIAIGRNLVINKHKVGSTKTKGGLLLAESQREDIRYIQADVVSVGSEVEGVKAGDQIYYDKHAGHGIEHKGEKYHIIRFQDVVVVL